MSIDPSLDRLQASLVQSKVQTDNNPLYQTIFGLINFSRKITNNLSSQVNEIVKIINGGNSPNKPGGLTGATYVTSTDQTPVLPQSRVLTAGTGITVSLATPKEIIVSTSGSAIADYVVLSDGFVTAPSPINNGAGSFIYVAYTP